MNILLIGSGGREHALAWKLAQSPRLGRLYAAPGNPGIAQHAEIVALDPADHPTWVAFCVEREIGLVVIGPEAPLVAGLADDLRAAGFAVFGPGAAAAQLEGSKGFTRNLCARAGIPTARYVRVSSREEAQAALDGFSPRRRGQGGWAGGRQGRDRRRQPRRSRGRTRCDLRRTCEAVLEEVLTGEEVSLFVLTDGKALMRSGPHRITSGSATAMSVRILAGWARTARRRC